MTRRLVALDVPGGPLFVDTLRRIWDEGDAAFVIDPRWPPALARARPGSDGAGGGGRLRRSLARSTRRAAAEHGDALVVATSGSMGDPKGVVLTHEAVAASAELTGQTARRDGRRPLARLPPPRPCRRTDGHHEGASSGDDVDGASTIRPRCGQRVAGHAGVARRHGAGSGRHGRFRQVVIGGAAPPSSVPAERRDHLWDDRDRQRCRVRRHTARRRRGRCSTSARRFSIKSPTLLRAYRDGSDPNSRRLARRRGTSDRGTPPAGSSSTAATT